jgi:anti-anti-sigma factor
MCDDVNPVQRAGRQVVVTLPEFIDVSNAGQIREKLLSVINRGATALIADMTTTVSCDHAGVDAVVRAYQRAVAAGTELRLAVTAPVVRRGLRISGLDRLVSIYPSLDAAIAARPSAPTNTLVVGLAAAESGGHTPPRRGGTQAQFPAARSPDESEAVTTPEAAWKLVDALQDGIALADGDGTIMLANKRLEEMFGYQHAELVGHPVESLVPAHLQETHSVARAQAPAARPMGARGSARRPPQRRDHVPGRDQPQPGHHESRPVCSDRDPRRH